MSRSEDALKATVRDWPMLSEAQRRLWCYGYEYGEHDGELRADAAKRAVAEARRLQEIAERESDALRSRLAAAKARIGHEEAKRAAAEVRAFAAEERAERLAGALRALLAAVPAEPFELRPYRPDGSVGDPVNIGYLVGTAAIEKARAALKGAAE